MKLRMFTIGIALLDLLTAGQADAQRCGPNPRPAYGYDAYGDGVTPAEMHNYWWNHTGRYQDRSGWIVPRDGTATIAAIAAGGARIATDPNPRRLPAGASPSAPHRVRAVSRASSV